MEALKGKEAGIGLVRGGGWSDDFGFNGGCGANFTSPSVPVSCLQNIENQNQAQKIYENVSAYTKQPLLLEILSLVNSIFVLARACFNVQ